MGREVGVEELGVANRVRRVSLEARGVELGEPRLHAVVVVTVAAWQAAVQDMVLAAIEAGIPGPDSLLTEQTYSIVAGRARGNVAGFNTPNPENTRQLLLEVGFDPRPFWTWTQMGGQGRSVDAYAS